MKILTKLFPMDWSSMPKRSRDIWSDDWWGVLPCLSWTRMARTFLSPFLVFLLDSFLFWWIVTESLDNVSKSMTDSPSSIIFVGTVKVTSLLLPVLIMSSKKPFESPEKLKKCFLSSLQLDWQMYWWWSCSTPGSRERPWISLTTHSEQNSSGSFEIPSVGKVSTISYSNVRVIILSLYESYRVKSGLMLLIWQHQCILWRSRYLNAERLEERHSFSLCMTFESKRLLFEFYVSLQSSGSNRQ